MKLVNLSRLQWETKSSNRMQAIFEYSIDTSEKITGGIFVAPVMTISDRSVSKTLLPLPVKALRRKKAGEQDQIDIVQPFSVIPFPYRNLSIEIFCRVFCWYLRVSILKGEPFVLWINTVGMFSEKLVQHLSPYAEKTVFDMSDDFTTFISDDSAALEKKLSAILKMSDVLICVNEHVYNKFSHPNKIIFTNCTSYQRLNAPDVGLEIPGVLPKPNDVRYVGFIGGIIDARIDLDLLCYLFDSLIEVKFVFVGYTNNAELLEKLTSYRNVVFSESVPYDHLGEVIRSFDVAMVPHLDNEHTRGNDLLKIWDYMACGVPVVTTRSSNVSRFDEYVYIADTHEQFKNFLLSLLNHEIPFCREKGIGIAMKNSWENKVPELLKEIGL